MNLDEIKKLVTEKVSELTGKELDADAALAQVKGLDLEALQGLDLESVKSTVTNAVSGLQLDEATTDGLLDKLAGVVDSATGGKFADKIDAARDFLDSKLGDQ